MSGVSRTPSPSRESRVLRAHSPWTAMRTRKQRRKGLMIHDSRSALPVRESDDDEDAENRAPPAKGEDTHMQDLEDKMHHMGIDRACVARPLEPRQDKGFSRFGSPPPAARSFRQRLVPLRSNNSHSRRRNHGPLRLSSALPFAHCDITSLSCESAFLRTASETGPAPVMPLASASWAGPAAPGTHPLGQLASFGSDGVLQGGPGAAPHLGPALPRSVAYLQQQQQQGAEAGQPAGPCTTWQQGVSGLARSAEGGLLGRAAPTSAAPVHFLHSLSAEGPLGSRVLPEAQTLAGCGHPDTLPVSDQGSLACAGVEGVPYPQPASAAKAARSSRLSKGTGGAAGGAGHSSPAEPAAACPFSSGFVLPAALPHHPLLTSGCAAAGSSGDAGARACSVAFDDAGRVMREAAWRAAGGRLPPQQSSPLPACLAHPVSSPRSMEPHTCTHPRPSPLCGSAHRRTSSDGSASSGGTFRISSSFRFPSCGAHEDSSHEQDGPEEGPPSSEHAHAGGACWPPTASAGGIAGVGWGKRSPQQQPAGDLNSPPVAQPNSRGPCAHGGRCEGGADMVATPARGAAGGPEAMQQSTDCSMKTTGGASVRCHGRAGNYSGGTGGSTDRKAPGLRCRASTPAGDLLGHTMVEGDAEEEGAAVGGGPGSAQPICRAMSPNRDGKELERDVSRGRDQDASSRGASNAMLALKRSGSLAARRQYARSAAAMGDGMLIGVGVATAPEQARGAHVDCAQQGGAAAVGGSGLWVAAAAVGSRGPATLSGSDAGLGQGAMGAAGLACSPCPPAAQGSEHSPGHGVEDELTHLMCDECDFVTPPHSPTAAARGSRGGLGVGSLDSALREGAYAAGEAALQLRRARCASTSAAERLDQQAGAGAAAAAAAFLQLHSQDCMPLLPGTQQHSPLCAHGQASHHPAHSHLQQHHHNLHGATPMTVASAMSVSAAVTPAVVCPQHHAHLMQGSFGPATAASTPGAGAPTPLLATPAWAVVAGPAWGGCSPDEGHPVHEEGLPLHQAGSGSSSGWGCDSDDEDGGAHMALDRLVCLEDFNGHISRAAARGNGGRAMQLWAELRTRNIAPDLRTLNMLMRCLSKTATDPDHAEQIMSEICELGDLTPNATTHILLAEIRLRFEQLLGL